MASPPSPAGPRKPLTPSQESRLIRYLDAELLRLSGQYESRHSTQATLPDLASFLNALLPLHSFILTIPAVPPSASLRTAYYLQLTGFLAPALGAYSLADDVLDPLFDLLDRFDRGWVAVLNGQEWDSANGKAREGEPTPSKSEAMRNTDRVRLETLVGEVKTVLSAALGLPAFVPLEFNPFQEITVPRMDPSTSSKPEEYDDGEEDMRSVSEASTPSLVSGGSTPNTDDDAMSIDTVTPSNDSDSDSDADFEEVIVASPTLSPRALASSVEDAYASAPSLDGSFQIHFTGPPPPTMTDGEFTLNGGDTPIVGQTRGFDPDEAYPPSEGEGGEEEGDDGIDDRTRERCKRVFGETEKVLLELKEKAG
ncbi:hypothetical protein JCM1840_005806 [Sporobolomyces johnsonii]